MSSDAAFSSAAIPDDYFRLTERIVRVEEAIQNQNLMMEKRFEAINKSQPPMKSKPTRVHIEGL